MKIILVGKMGAGKDTVADYLVEKYGFVQMAFGDKVKEIARELFPDAFKTGKPRALLQSLGQKMREIKLDCWTNYVMRQVQGIYGFNIVITDCRYKNELEIAKKNGFIPVRVRCSDKLRQRRLLERDGLVDEKTFNHISETELEKSCVGYALCNNRTKEELYITIDSLMEHLGVKKES